MIITLHFWMIPFICVPLVGLVTCYVPREQLDRGDLVGVTLFTSAAWVFMALARWLP